MAVIWSLLWPAGIRSAVPGANKLSAGVTRYCVGFWETGAAWTGTPAGAAEGVGTEAVGADGALGASAVAGPVASAKIVSLTRRFLALPSALSLGATGLELPYPAPLRFLESTPSWTNSCTRALASASDKSCSVENLEPGGRARLSV